MMDMRTMRSGRTNWISGVAKGKSRMTKSLAAKGCGGERGKAVERKRGPVRFGQAVWGFQNLLSPKMKK